MSDWFRHDSVRSFIHGYDVPGISEIPEPAVWKWMAQPWLVQSLFRAAVSAGKRQHSERSLMFWEKNLHMDLINVQSIQALVG